MAATAPSTPGPVLSVRGATKVYPMGEVEVQALRGVDFDLAKGELVVLLGPSGSGKSTLLNLMGGLDTPTAGTLRFEDLQLEKASRRALTLYRRHHVGFVFQGYNLIPSLTARENVELVAELTPGAMRAEEALSRVGLGDRLDHFPSQLSGGEQQRVAIARAIAKRPGLLLCDEPTGALDQATGRLVLDALAEVNQELGTPTVVITHNESIGGLADRVVRLKDGRVVSETRNESRRSTAELTW